MTTSSKALYDFFEGKGSLCPAIVCDLFGYINWSSNMREKKHDTIAMFIGLYKGLYNMGVTHQEIHRCLCKHQLDELIHTKYLMFPNFYYKGYCDTNIVLSDCEYVQPSNDSEEQEPLIYTIQPSYVREASLWTGFPNIDEIILLKIQCYQYQDARKNRPIIDNQYVSVEDVKKLLIKQEQKCYVCGDIVLLDDYCATRCMYQITLDRIDNKLPHNKDNVLICCYYCNCYGNPGVDDCDLLESTIKLCPNKCHCIERTVSRSRTEVPKEEMAYLRLKL